jgi:manganese efflux pump family protein
METLILFIIAFGLAMDSFAVAITNSTVSGTVKPGIPLKASLVFAFSHIILFLAGSFAGARFQDTFQEYGHWIAVTIFLVSGLKMIGDAIRRRPEAKVFDINNTRVIVLLSLAVAMDAFLAGIALGFMGVRPFPAALIIAIAVWLFTFSGLAGGHRLGLSFVKPTAIFGGICMLIAATHYLLPLILAAAV